MGRRFPGQRRGRRWITGATLPVDSGILGVTPLMMASHLRDIPPLPG